MLVESMSRATGAKVQFRLDPTVNPLTYKLTLHFSEVQSGKQLLLLWNLLQQYAARNDAVLSQKAQLEPARIITTVLLRQRLGLPRSDVP